MNLIDSIEQHRKTFSKSELKVCEYILKYPEHIETYTITKVALEANASTSAVLRFCQTLGFQGYKDFRFEIINYLRNNRQENPSGNEMDDFLNDYSNNVNQLHELDHQKLEQLMNALTNGKVNYVSGIYYSALPAKELALGLNDLNQVSLFTEDYMDAAHLTRSLSADATFVWFSIDGNKKNFSYFMADMVNEMPKNSFLITLNPKAELSEIFSNTIVLPGRTFSNRSVIDTQAIPMLFVEMLLNLIHDKIQTQKEAQPDGRTSFCVLFFQIINVS